MSEVPGSHNNEPTPEITDDQKRDLLKRARALAPYAGQAVDRFGAYTTKFMQEGQFITVHIPGLSGFVQEGALISTTVQIIKHVPEDISDRYTLVRLTSFCIDELSLTTEYLEDERIFDAVTGVSLQPDTPKSMHQIIEAYALEREVRATVIDEAKGRTLSTLLDSLKPEQIF